MKLLNGIIDRLSLIRIALSKKYFVCACYNKVKDNRVIGANYIEQLPEIGNIERKLFLETIADFSKELINTEACEMIAYHTGATILELHSGHNVSVIDFNNPECTIGETEYYTPVSDDSKWK